MMSRFMAEVRVRFAALLDSVGVHASQGLVWLNFVQLLGDGVTWNLVPPSTAQFLPSGGRDGDRRSPLALMTVSMLLPSRVGLSTPASSLLSSSRDRP